MSLALRYRGVPGEPRLRYRGPDGRTVTVARLVQGASLAAIIGPQGSGTTLRYVHTQSGASSSWIVNHNFGVKPAAVSVLSVGGVEVDAEITHVSDNQLIVGFSAPYAGSVVVTA